MTKEMKQDFTRRITQANKTELIVILYEMFMQYHLSAKEFMMKEDSPQYQLEIKRAMNCVDELIASLNMEYPVAINLFRLYQYVKRELLVAKSGSLEALDHASYVIENLHEAYMKIKEEDKSNAIMLNAETVFAGMTYGKNSMNETIGADSKNRGYLI